MSHILILAGVTARYAGRRYEVVSLFTDGGVRLAECYAAGTGADDDPATIPVCDLEFERPW